MFESAENIKLVNVWKSQFPFILGIDFLIVVTKLKKFKINMRLIYNHFPQ